MEKQTENINKDKPEAATNAVKSNWFLTGASVRGNGHIKDNIPCQDSHSFELLENDWGIAVVADGAGSYQYSDQGSDFVAKNALKVFKTLIKNQKWASENRLPEKEEWKSISRDKVLEVRKNLEDYSKEIELPFEQFGSTLIVLIFNPKGILITHVGDGRAGYMNKDGEWLAAMKPIEGDSVGETVFVTLDLINNPEFIQSDIISDDVAGITAMSDGCESLAWKRVEKIGESKFKKMNIPNPDFYDATLKGFRTLLDKGLEEDEIKNLWAEYLKDGHKVLVEELDDKTLLFGFLKQNKKDAND